MNGVPAAVRQLRRHAGRGAGLSRRLLLALLLAALVSALFPTSAEALRCGRDRWAVKTGTDADAARIDLTAVTHTSIPALLRLDAPTDRPDDRRLPPTETTVYSVTAFLTMYKWENSERTGDSDYHLVISDSDGNSIVAEIPNPDPACVGTTSPLRPGIARARQQFDAVLQASGRFKKVDPPLPVRVTGVGFFDTPSHGAGSAVNGIELHPLLDIVFNPGASPTPGARQLLGNAGFEGGDASPWDASKGVITDSSKRKAHGGSAYAWLAGYGKTHADTLSQTVTIPSDATKVTLSFWMSVDTEETTSAERYDTLTIEIRSPSGKLLQHLATFSNLDATSGYEKQSFALTRFKGQTVVLAFTADEDESLETSFVLDDFALTVQ